MPVAFNPFNPMHSWMGFSGGASAVVPRERVAPGKPIEVEAHASDTGISMTVGKNSVTLRGVTDGPEPARDIFGSVVGDYARSVRVSLDVASAPTTDVFGNTNYREKNSRAFMVYTKKGASAADLAHALAKKVNEHRSFRAEVEVARDGSATLRFERR